MLALQSSAFSQGVCIELNQSLHTARAVYRELAVSITVGRAERFVELGDKLLRQDRLFQ